ncbi:uncharacterized protein LOC141673682 [Apium graveolens]|uniref:uncharacterized protein LOC141673682 n=1 Tax=Apium graveolens TaxID=4045 RepID=UPI003D7A1A89
MKLDGNVKNLKVLEIDLLTASNFNLSSRHNQISADWNIQMNFKTADKRGYFKFESTKVSIYYNDKRIALKEIRSFQLSSKHPASMHFGGEFTGSSGYVDDAIIRNVGRGITVGTVKFNVVFEILVKKTFIKGYAAMQDWIPRVGYCENVELCFGSPSVSKARMLNGSHKCQLYTKYRSYDSDDDTYGQINPLCFGTYGGGRICV